MGTGLLESIAVLDIGVSAALELPVEMLWQGCSDSRLLIGRHRSRGFEPGVVLFIDRAMRTFGKSISRTELLFSLVSFGSRWLDQHVAPVETNSITSHAYGPLYIEPLSRSPIIIAVDIHKRQGSHIDDLGEDIEQRSLRIIFRVIERYDLVTLDTAARGKDLLPCRIELYSIAVLVDDHPVSYIESGDHRRRGNDEELEEILVYDYDPEDSEYESIHPAPDLREHGALLRFLILPELTPSGKTSLGPILQERKQAFHTVNLAVTVQVDKTGWPDYLSTMRKKPELPEVEPVRLRPILGIRPGIVILASIILMIVLILFLLFVLPGIMQKGGYVRFDLNTVDTAIYLDDGTYLGSTEGSVYYVPHGERTFRFSIDGANAGSVTVDIPHRIFFTLFSHRITTIEYDIEKSEELEKAVRERFVSSIAAWSRIIDYDERYHFPPLFSSFAHNAIALGFDDISDEMLYGALHLTSDAMRRDLDKALSMLSSSPLAYSSPELEALIRGDAVPAPSADGQTITAEERSGAFFLYDGTTITMGEGDASSFPEANERAVETKVMPFAIASRPVSEYEWALFVESNPYWSASNKAELIADGMVDEGYLEGMSLTTSVHSMVPIRNISYNAAEAYAAWLSEETGEDVMIPTEAEWTVAARSASGKRYASALIAIDNDDTSPSFMMGQLWEMTSSPYIPLARISDYDKAMALGEAFPYDDMIVKGGSYINRPEDITMDTVGAIDRAATSEYVTLRIGIRQWQI